MIYEEASVQFEIDVQSCSQIVRFASFPEITSAVLTASSAAKLVKHQLANKAMKAAKGAEAVIPGKEVFAIEIQEEESSSLQQLPQLEKTVQQIPAELKFLQASFQVGQGNAANSQQALEGLKMQRRRLTFGSCKIDRWPTKNLANAKQDLSKMKEAPKKVE